MSDVSGGAAVEVGRLQILVLLALALLNLYEPGYSLGKGARTGSARLAYRSKEATHLAQRAFISI